MEESIAFSFERRERLSMKWEDTARKGVPKYAVLPPGSLLMFS
jgi:hypothetical protein